MKTEKVLNIESVKATTAIVKNRYVRATGAQAAAGEQVLGVADLDAAIGAQTSVKTHGIILVEAGAAVAAEARVQSDASGRAITLAAGKDGGFALDAATAAGQLIRIKL
jgi:TPP-dependent indolepyruvate ferredoxin oxidoreductase alpha subunit